MSQVIVNKSTGLIKYDDDKTMWSADVIFNSEKKEIMIIGTTRALTDEERSNIITAILNKYFFGSYFDYEYKLNTYILKNRGVDKKKEKNIKDVSYSMLAETIIELDKNDNECYQIAQLRNLYREFKIAVGEAKENKKYLKEYVDTEIEGSIIKVNKFKNMLDDVIPELEHGLAKIFGSKINITYKTEFKNGKKKVNFVIEEA